MKLLEGKKVLVTGGSRGIGRAICEIFAREGADIAFNYSSRVHDAEKTTEMIQAHGQRALSFMVSVVDKVAVPRMVRQIIHEFGRIDVLVNNAAINRGDSFVTMTEKSWHEVIDTNINGLFHITKPVFKQMVRQRAGKIVNITSIGGIRSLPTSVHYATTKAAITGFTKCLSREASNFGVTVNAIAAGMFDTDLGHSLPEHFKEAYQWWCSMKRFGKPSELAEVAAFLASDRNSYMNGEVIILDGGSIT